MKLVAAAVGLLLVRAFGQAPIEGHWEGVMEREGASLSVIFDFSTQGGIPAGRFSSLSQRALEYPLDKVVYSAPAIHLELGGSILFDGSVSSGRISGTFREGDGKGTFSLGRAKPVPPPYERKDVTFTNGEASLAGTLLLPRTGGLHAGVVFLHGSGPESRWGTSLFLADRFARHGVAALVFDKRGVGESTGDWRYVDFDVLAGDYLAAVHFLQRQRGVNPRQVGIHGHSQGATISPLIASRSGDVAFVIAAAAIGGPVYEQEFYRVRNVLADRGLKEEEIEPLMAYYRAWITIARTGQVSEEFEPLSARASSMRGFRIVAAPPNDDLLWKWYPAVGNFNSIPYWEKVKVPVLLAYGERDRNTPPAASLAGIAAALRKAGNPDYTELIVPKAAHNMTIQREPGEPFFWWYAAPGYADTIVAWVRLRFSGKSGDQ